MELREAHRQHNGHADQHKIAVDDVVIVHSKDEPRGFWKLGRVKQLTIGRDDKVRGAVVKVSGKGRQATSLHRPIQLLYPLEVPHPTPEESGDELETAGQDISSSSGSVGPRPKLFILWYMTQMIWKAPDSTPGNEV